VDLFTSNRFDLSMNDAAIKKRFGARIRSLRGKSGLSQEGLAEKCDLDRTYIGGVERGERNISLLNIHRLADALDVAPKSLFESD
jgi:transcriptional regulator with XRE-family HTH domain